MMKPEYIVLIKEEAQRVREKYGLEADAAIGDYIFKILNDECILIVKPTPELQDLDGFSEEKVIDNSIRTVVYINTVKTKEKQNFCAAHELGHRYKLDVQIKDKFPNEVYYPVEDIMNRFAAELMLPENGFKKHVSKYLDECDGETDESGKKIISFSDALKMITQLMDFYYVPYKAVVKRLEETGRFTQRDCEMLEKYDANPEGRAVVEKYISENGFTRLRTPDHKIQYSLPVEKNLQDILTNPEITKYMSSQEIEKYMHERGLTPESAELIQNIRDIEAEMLSVDVDDDSEDEQKSSKP